MTPEDLATIREKIRTSQSTPLIALQCGSPPSVQQVANEAWIALGKKMGFDGMTVEASATKAGPLFFTAEPL